MQNPSALIHSHDVITLLDEAEGWLLLTDSRGDVTPPTRKTESVYNISHHWYSLEWGIFW